MSLRLYVVKNDGRYLCSHRFGAQGDRLEADWTDDIEVAERFNQHILELATPRFPRRWKFVRIKTVEYHDQGEL